MKALKLILLTATVCLLNACSAEPEMLSTTSDAPKPIDSVEKIVQIAEQAYDSFYPSASRSLVTMSKNIVVVKDEMSRTCTNDSLLYIVNATNNNGFVVLGAKETEYEVLAVSDCGNIADIESIDNPGMSMFIDLAKVYVENNIETLASGGPLNPMPQCIEIMDTIAYDIVLPRCPVTWGQQYPAGKYCPNQTSGCGPLAVAIALSYFEVPTSIDLTYYNRDRDSDNLNWYRMKTYVVSRTWNDYLNASFNPIIWLSEENNLGRLCRQIGELSQADYIGGNYIGTTGVTASNLRQGLLNLNTGLNISDFIISTPFARNILGEGIILAFSYSENRVGHAWVIDGYRHINIIYHRWYYDITSQDYTRYVRSERNEDFQHINWGWHGECNGYFNYGVFDNAVQYDDPEIDNNFNYNFNVDLKYLKIEP